MKELTIEQKAQRYDEAIEKAESIYNEIAIPSATTKGICTYIFPELKESEDEKIRKELLNAFQESEDSLYMVLTPHRRESFIAWLEKQGEKKSFARYKVGDTIYYDSFGRLVNFVIANIVEDGTDNPMYEDKDGNSVFQNDIIEQKPADKVEPKFDEGEWITNGDYTWKIVEVKPLDYTLQSQDGNIVDDTISHVDEQFHSFTIQDAKDGDVLVNWNNTAFIFKAIEDETVKFHIAYNEKWDTIKTPSTKLSHLGLPEPQFEFHPATKEQRDALMKAMADAGYTFDFESKELKKIEQKSAWSEEGERIVQNLLSLWKEVMIEPTCCRFGLHKDEVVDFLKSLKDRVQPKQEWSEEDESRMENLCHFLKEYGIQYYGALTLEGTINWLKSIKHQNVWISVDKEVYVKEPVLAQKKDKSDTFLGFVVCCDHTLTPNVYERYMILGNIVSKNTWKPSDEQIKVLEAMLTLSPQSPAMTSALIELYEQLKKLKGY